MEGIRGKVLSVILVSAILLSGCGNDLVSDRPKRDWKRRK